MFSYHGSGKCGGAATGRGICSMIFSRWNVCFIAAVGNWGVVATFKAGSSNYCDLTLKSFKMVRGTSG